MDIEAMNIPKGYKPDHRGALVPVKSIRPIDLERDKLVRDMAAQALDLNRELAAFKAGVMEAIKAFVQRSADEYGVTFGGRKGNITLTSYDGQFRLLIAVNDYIDFDERLQIAKEMIDNCIRRWAKGARTEIKTLVEDAFRVDKKGSVDTKRILGLRRLNIQDDEWQRAMEAISESVQVTVSKEYVRFYLRNARDEYDQINLDIAAV